MSSAGWIQEGLSSIYGNELLLFLLCSSAYLQAVQATMILATILCCVGFFVFILQLFKLQQGERFFFTAVIQLCACEWHTFLPVLTNSIHRCLSLMIYQPPPPPGLCVMTAASIYTDQKDSFHVPSLKEGSYGSSYILAWISFPLTLISGLMYLVLRKRK